MVLGLHVSDRLITGVRARAHLIKYGWIRFVFASYTGIHLAQKDTLLGRLLGWVPGNQRLQQRCVAWNRASVQIRDARPLLKAAPLDLTIRGRWQTVPDGFLLGNLSLLETHTNC